MPLHRGEDHLTTSESRAASRRRSTRSGKTARLPVGEPTARHPVLSADPRRKRRSADPGDHYTGQTVRTTMIYSSVNRPFFISEFPFIASFFRADLKILNFIWPKLARPGQSRSRIQTPSFGICDHLRRKSRFTANAIGLDSLRSFLISSADMRLRRVLLRRSELRFVILG